MNISEIAKLLGSRGGKKSVKVRMGGMTKRQRSEYMKKVRNKPKKNKKTITIDKAVKREYT